MSVIHTAGIPLLDKLAEQARHNPLAAHEHVTQVARDVASTPEATAAFRQAALKQAPAVTAANGWVAMHLLYNLLALSRSEPSQLRAAVICTTQNLPQIARQDGMAARLLTSKLLEETDVKLASDASEFVCREFLISARGGPGRERTYIFFPQQPLDKKPPLAIATSASLTASWPDYREAMTKGRVEQDTYHFSWLDGRVRHIQSRPLIISSFISQTKLANPEV